MKKEEHKCVVFYMSFSGGSCSMPTACCCQCDKSIFSHNLVLTFPSNCKEFPMEKVEDKKD